MEYQPLLEAGIHNMAQADMHGIFVQPFKNPERRERLLLRLEALLTKLKEVPIRMEIWIDGSFATSKESPGDVDLVVVFEQNEVNNLATDHQTALLDIFSNQKTTKLRYECDVYFIMNDMHDKSYWRGLFGFDRNEKPKGIARLILEEHL